MKKEVSLLRDDYNLYILPRAREKMELYCDLSEGEIGWLGSVEKIEGEGFLITDCFLLKQEVHATTTEIDPTALLELWEATPEEDRPKIKMWGHSHVQMSTNPSGQDDDQMDYFKDGNPWFIRLITNKRREYYIDVYDYDKGIKVHMDQSDLLTFNPGREERKAAIEKEIEEKVSKKEVHIFKDDPEEETDYDWGFIDKLTE